jgi:hypothetical protein
MNCSLCQENLEAYRRSALPDDMMIQVKVHLEECSECYEISVMDRLADRIIRQEISKNPSELTTQRIMQRIMVSAGQPTVSEVHRTGIIRPLLIASSIAAALFAGILIGNLYKSSDTTPAGIEELRMMNDSDIEAISGLSNE